MPGLIGLQRLLRDHERLLGLGGLDHGRDQLAVDEQTVRVRHPGPHLDRVGALVDLHVDEVELANLLVGGAVGEPNADHHIALIRTLCGGTTPDLQELALGHWKGDVDRVLGHDRGERAAPGPTRSPTEYLARPTRPASGALISV